MKILEDISSGLDVGTSSVGWGLIDTQTKCIPPHTVIHQLGRDGATPGKTEEIRYAAGVVKFDPVEAKEGSKWVSRSGKRGFDRRSRRTLKRKRGRLSAIRELFKELDLIDSSEPSQFFNARIKHFRSPWELRGDALVRKLSGEELFRTLYHIAGHRAYEANSKAGEDDELAALGDNVEQKPTRQKKKKDGKPVKPASFGEQLKTLTANIEASGDTVAVYFNKNFPEKNDENGDWLGRKRGLHKQHDRLVKRRLLWDEVKRIFNAQRNLGSALADKNLEGKFYELASYVTTGQDSEKFVGECAFAQDKNGKPLKRAPRFSPSYEKFRFLQKLSNLRMIDGSVLSHEQRMCALASFGDKPGYSWAVLGETLQLDPAIAFKDAPKKLENDFVMARGECARGTAALKNELGGLNVTPDMLDIVAAKLSYNADIRSIEAGLRASALPNPVVDRAIYAARTGAFKFFKGAGYISVQAARQLSDRLLLGEDYTQACAHFDWDHEAPENSPLAGLRRPATLKQVLDVINRPENPPVQSPGARKTLIAALKQFSAVVQEFGGLPGSVHIELARDIGRSAEARNEIEENQKNNRKRNQTLETLFESTIGRKPRAGSEDMLRFRLWREQQCRCPYSFTYISPAQFRDDLDGSLLHIDHILPWSWSHDDSYENKILCYASENARKGNLTPWEYFRNEPPEKWDTFKAWVEHLPKLKTARERKKKKEDSEKKKDEDDIDTGIGGYKCRNLLVEGDEAIAKLKERLSSRHLNDTRHATSILMQAITCLYPIEYRRGADGKQIEKQRVFARPGHLTYLLRQAWGINHLKYDENGERLSDDRNHAVDALVVAAITNAGLERMTQIYQQQEKMGGRMGRALSRVPPPWPEFARNVEMARNAVFVVRSERRRARGEGHAATIKQVHTDDNGKSEVYARKPIDKKLKLEDLDKIKDAERNRATVESLRAWIEAGYPKDAPPKSPKGDVIRNIRVLTKDKPAVNVRGGTADRGKMVRVDLFAKPNNKGKEEYYCVPIYPHQVINRRKPIPNRAYASGKGEWPEMNAEYKFLFSLYHHSWVEIVDAKGQPKEGYFKKFDSNTGAINLGLHSDVQNVIDGRSIGVKTLSTINKFAVDRLGRRSRIAREVRTWHGEVCISANPPG